VIFYDSVLNLLDASHGLASISGHNNVTLPNLTTQFDAGFGATVLDLNLHPDQQPTGTVTFTAYDQFGGSAPLLPFAIRPGENHL
jgi:hypothetical protein